MRARTRQTIRTFLNFPKVNPQSGSGIPCLVRYTMLSVSAISVVVATAIGSMGRRTYRNKECGSRAVQLLSKEQFEHSW